MIDEQTLQEVEVRVAGALERGEPLPLPVLGYGEISVVLGVQHHDELFACKRMPPFPDRPAVERYRSVCELYALRLREIGLALPEHEVVEVQRPGGAVVYYVQRGLPAASMAHRLLHERDAEGARNLLRQIADRVACVAEFNRDHPDQPVGLDGQVSNWAWTDQDKTLWYLDTSTPLLRQGGRELLDVEIFLRSLPRMLVPLVRWLFLREILDRYYDTRQVLRDLVGNLIKERLEALVPEAMQIANQVLGQRLCWLGAEELTEHEIRRYYRGDARMWEILQRLRRLERFISVRVLRRPYPVVLPTKIER